MCDRTTTTISATVVATQPTSHDEEGLPMEVSVPLDRPFSELKKQLLEQLERAYIVRCLAETSSLSQAARTSGLSRKHLRTLMAKHGLRREQQQEP